jgi:uncharacterized repeat protein (TIGR04138 family)
MSSYNNKLLGVVRNDSRYAYEAYEFVFLALEHTQKMLGREATDESSDPNETRHHVSPRQLLDGVRGFALQEFGLMARAVFRQWGIQRTDDIGEIVFNLIEAELMSKTADDSREDFQGIYDLDEALVDGFRIVIEDE